MTIPFNLVPANLRVPGLYIEVDPTGAAQSFGGQPYKTLVVGQRLTTGSQAANVPVRVSTANQAALLFGKGSMLAAMASVLFQNSQTIDATFIAMDDPGAGTAATASVTVGAAPTNSGTAVLYVAGERVQVGITATQTQAQVAAAIVAAVAAKDNMQCTAAVDGVDDQKVNFTARHKGTCGNGLTLTHSHLEGDLLPAGLALTIVDFANGAGEPDLAAAFAATGGEHFNVMAVPYTDTALMTVLHAELADRAGPLRQIGAQAFTATKLGWAAALAFGDARNSQYITTMYAHGSPSAPWEWAAAATAQVSDSASEHPARPFQTLPLWGVVAPKEADRLSLLENNGLLFDGISTHSVAPGGLVSIQRLITMYQEDSSGGPDVSLLDVNTLLTIDRLRFELRQRFTQRYPRAMLGDDGVASSPSLAVVTPSVARAEVISLFEEWQARGLVEGAAQFERDLIVERSETDPNRMNIRLRPDVMNQLRVVGAQVAFVL